MTSNCWSIISNHSLWYIFYYFHLSFYVSWKDYAVSMKDFVLMDDQCSQAISKQLCLWHLSNAQQIKCFVSSFFLLKSSEAIRWLFSKFVNFMSVVSFNFFWIPVKSLRLDETSCRTYITSFPPCSSRL